MLRTAEKQANDGDTVAVFGARSESSGLDVGIEKFNFDVPDYHTLSGASKIRAAKDVFWSKSAAAEISDALDHFKPDVVHLHNYAHQLSSSIIHAIRAKDLPIVNTAHDYKLICPAYVANVEDADCFACSHKLSLKLLQKRCHHGSSSWSATVGVEAMIVRKGKLVPDVVIGPSQFMTDALKDSWLGELTNVRLLRNPVDPSGVNWVGAGDFLLYVGRLSREKGVDQLLLAAAAIGIPLKIAGEGPLLGELRNLATSLGAPVEFLGHLGQEALAMVRQDCRAQVLSSAWPENAPLSALEAAADGVPLIVSARGGLPEFGSLGARVVVIESFDSESLADAVEVLPSLKADLDRFRGATDWTFHVGALRSIYLESMGRN